MCHVAKQCLQCRFVIYPKFKILMLSTGQILKKVQLLAEGGASTAVELIKGTTFSWSGKDV
jgi:hypothetical protein